MQPVDTSGREGEPVTFAVQVDGSPPLVTEWQRNGETIPGGSGTSVTIVPSSVSDDGDLISVVVSNSLGSITSSDAVLTVTPGLILTASANGSADLLTYHGWPLLIEAALIHPDPFDTNATPLLIASTNGPWVNALALKVQDSQNQPVNWNFHAAPFTNETVLLTPDSGGRMLWWLAPNDTAQLSPGSFTILVTLNTTNVTRTNAWRGVARSVPIHLSITNEPAPLSPIQIEQKQLRLADYALWTGDSAQAQREVDTLLTTYPTDIGGLTYDTYLKEAAGLFDAALQSAFGAINQVASQWPNAGEPPKQLLKEAASLQAILAPPALKGQLVNHKVVLSWDGNPGLDYRLQVSPDLKAWTMLTTNFTVTGNSFSYAVDVGQKAQFFRVARQSTSTR
jgi:hypothetical protein